MELDLRSVLPLIPSHQLWRDRLMSWWNHQVWLGEALAGFDRGSEAYPEERDVLWTITSLLPTAAKQVRFLQVENYQPAFSDQSHFLLNFNDPAKLGLLQCMGTVGSVLKLVVPKADEPYKPSGSTSYCFSQGHSKQRSELETVSASSLWFIIWFCRSPSLFLLCLHFRQKPFCRPEGRLME